MKKLNYMVPCWTNLKVILGSLDQIDLSNVPKENKNVPKSFKVCQKNFQISPSNVPKPQLAKKSPKEVPLMLPL
jgi:hypothetical protein